MFKPKGITPPVVTPFNDDETVNLPVYHQMLRHLISNGVHGVFTMGTSSEFYAVSDAEYRALLEATVEEAAGKVDVYAGANGITTKEVISKIRVCEQVPGIDALSVLTPFFISQTQDEVYEHYIRIADASAIPIIIYNNRPKTGVHVEPVTVARLAKHPNIIGIKDSTGDMTNALEYMRLTADAENFSVITGRDTLIYSCIDAGAAGSISSCANVAPRLVSSIYDLYMAGDRKGAFEAQMKLNPLRIACSMGTFPAVIKEALVMQGMPVGKCMAPIGELRHDEKEKLRKVLIDMEVL